MQNELKRPKLLIPYSMHSAIRRPTCHQAFAFVDPRRSLDEHSSRTSFWANGITTSTPLGGPLQLLWVPPLVLSMAHMLCTSRCSTIPWGCTASRGIVTWPPDYLRDDGRVHRTGLWTIEHRGLVHVVPGSLKTRFEATKHKEKL